MHFLLFAEQVIVLKVVLKVVFVHLSNQLLVCFCQIKNPDGVPFVAELVKNPTSIYEDAGSVPVLAHWVKDPALP